IQYTINGTISSYVAIDQEGSYTITATDVNGCQKTFTTHIIKQNCAECEAYVPGAFTPNGDGLNDIFRAKLTCFASYFHCRIFDRWGKQVFESSDIRQGWDGTYKGQKMIQGAYVYIVNYKTVIGTDKIISGVV